MTTNQIPINPSTLDRNKEKMHRIADCWEDWAKYMEKLKEEKENEVNEKVAIIKEKDKTIAEISSRETGWSKAFCITADDLEHHKDMLYHVLHRPYRPKPRSNKRSTKNKGNKYQCCAFQHGLFVWIKIV